MAERKGLVELVRRHPAVLIDDGAPGKHQDPAEAGQRHPGEGQEQRGGRAEGVGGWMVGSCCWDLIRLLGGRC